MMLIVDGNNLAYRALYKLQGLSTDGEDTSVSYGVLRMLHATIKQFSPSSVVVCFDGGVPSYRRTLVPTYKTGRVKSDEIDWYEVYRQIDELCDMALPLHGILTIRRKHVEADDLMAACAVLATDRPYIYTSDEDMLQCIDAKTSVIRPSSGEVYTIDNVEKLTGVKPGFWLAYKCLIGDSSDNVPGIDGVGPVTAKKVLKTILRKPEDVTCWMSALIGAIPTLNMRQRAAAEEYLDAGQFRCSYEAMDLSVDMYGSRQIVLNSIWTPVNTLLLKRWLMNKQFISLISNEYNSVYGRLSIPSFGAMGVRVPLSKHCDKETV